MKILEEAQVTDYTLSDLSGLVDYLNAGLQRPLSLEEIESLLSRLELELPAYDQYVVRDAADFEDPAHYERVVVVKSGFASLIIISWLSGHKSPIHDHQSSHCGVRVVEGTMTEDMYGRVPGAGRNVRKISTDAWQPGEVSSTDVGIGIHRVANEMREQLLVTLHLYSPPLENMTYYTEVE